MFQVWELQVGYGRGVWFEVELSLKNISEHAQFCQSSNSNKETTNKCNILKGAERRWYMLW